MRDSYRILEMLIIFLWSQQIGDNGAHGLLTAPPTLQSDNEEAPSVCQKPYVHSFIHSLLKEHILCDRHCLGAQGEAGGETQKALAVHTVKTIQLAVTMA